MTIQNRPQSLMRLPHYSNAPELDVQISYDAVPELLSIEMLTMSGVHPILSDAPYPNGIATNKLNEDMISFYRNRESKFQLIFVVACTYGWIEKMGAISANPYSIWTYPASKRGAITECNIDLVDKLSLDKLQAQSSVYLDFNPFTGERSLFGPYEMCVGRKDIFTDSIGFVIESYFLETTYDRRSVCITQNPESSAYVQKRHRRDHIRNFLTPFSEVSPRHIWGCESPIELFLAQALAGHGLTPSFQCIVFEDGSVSPSYWHSYLENKITKRNGVVTVADMFFPNHKKMIFCDSREFHSSETEQAKDESISQKLNDLGFDHLRVSGTEIVNNLEAVTDRIIQFVQN